MLENLLFMKMNYLDEHNTYVGVFQIYFNSNLETDGDPDLQYQDNAEIVVYTNGHADEGFEIVRERLLNAAKTFLRKSHAALEPMNYADTQNTSRERQELIAREQDDALAAAIALS